MQVARRHHGKSVADECVVRIIPFRSLGIQPDATFRNEIRQLREREREEFLDERDVVDVTLLAGQQLAVSTEAGHTLTDPSGQFGIKHDRGTRILPDLVVILDAVRHVGMDKDRGIEQLVEPLRIKPTGPLE